MRRRTSLLTLAVCGVALTSGGIACTSHRSRPRGHYEHKRLSVAGEVYHYAVYVPSSYRTGFAVPLVVVLHGCNTTIDQLAAASEYDQVAEQRRFIVLYPDISAADGARGGCWAAIWDPRAEGRGRGDASAVADMTRAVIARWRIDRSRVYAIGMSAGAFETPILGADYPDLYAAIGIHSGAAYLGGEQGCLAEDESPADTNALARAALYAMGARAHVMPVIVFHGDKDSRIPYRCGRQALQQRLRTDDLILEHERRPQLPPAPTGVLDAIVPGGHAYTVDSGRSSPAGGSPARSIGAPVGSSDAGVRMLRRSRGASFAGGDQILRQLPCGCHEKPDTREQGAPGEATLRKFVRKARFFGPDWVHCVLERGSPQGSCLAVVGLR